MAENDIHEALIQAPDELKGLEKTVATLLNGFQSTYGECIKYLGGMK